MMIVVVMMRIILIRLGGGGKGGRVGVGSRDGKGSFFYLIYFLRIFT